MIVNKYPGGGRTARASFLNGEEGLALTEYLILLGLLTAGAVTSVLAIGNSMDTAWAGWSNWFDANLGPVASASMTGKEEGDNRESGGVQGGGSGDTAGDTGAEENQQEPGETDDTPAEGQTDPQEQDNDAGDQNETGKGKKEKQDKKDPTGQEVRLDGKGKTDKNPPKGQTDR